jgi:hypothetical protein
LPLLACFPLLSFEHASDTQLPRHASLWDLDFSFVTGSASPVCFLLIFQEKLDESLRILKKKELSLA